ncbi:MAG: DUF4249 domain-containing protein [Chitinophagaceae bacterium]
MKKVLQTLSIILLPVLWLIACKKPYNPPEIKANTNFLVVDGSITCGNAAVTTITLSRTTNLGDSVLFNPELNAFLSIEQEQGNVFSIIEKNDGVYRSQPLNLDPAKRYRLQIRTADNKIYVSDYVSAKTSPAIDSLTWKQGGDATISVHTHDPLNNTRYYRWEYNETWTYASLFHAEWIVKDGWIYLRDSTTQIDSCWRSANSNDIVVGSSVALSKDVISDFPVAVIPQHNEKLGKRYSILVKQYALTEEAFRYLQLIQKNTEQLGTLFDAQPSQLKGNIQSAGNPIEPVIGFITASTVTEKRLFIQHDQLTNWVPAYPIESCGAPIIIDQNRTDFRIWDYPDPDYTIYYYITGGTMAIIKKPCIDCRERGGVNVKPSFW